MSSTVRRARTAGQGACCHLMSQDRPGRTSGLTPPEIELLVEPGDVSLPYFPTTRLHALAAVDLALTVG